MKATRWFVIALGAAVLATGSYLVGQPGTQPPPAPAAGKVGRPAKTIFLDVALFGRRGRATDRMNKLHEEQAREGWTFCSMSPYTENGDLEGFFITYTKE